MRSQPNPRLEPRPTPKAVYGFQRDGRRPGMVLPPPGLCPQFDSADMGAWKALNAGTASPHLQELALEHLAFMTGFNLDPFNADPIVAAYNTGRRSVFVNVFSIIQFPTQSQTRMTGEQG